LNWGYSSDDDHLAIDTVAGTARVRSIVFIGELRKTLTELPRVGVTKYRPWARSPRSFRSAHWKFLPADRVWNCIESRRPAEFIYVSTDSLAATETALPPICSPPQYGLPTRTKMKEELSSLIKKYEPLGQWEAGELLLRPADALRLADDLLAIGVLISGVDIWYRARGGIAEDPSCLDFSGAIGSQWPIERIFGAAKRFIQNGLPPHIELVSFVLSDD
jgi:hypothetical protein